MLNLRQSLESSEAHPRSHLFHSQFLQCNMLYFTFQPPSRASIKKRPGPHQLSYVRIMIVRELTLRATVQTKSPIPEIAHLGSFTHLRARRNIHRQYQFFFFFLLPINFSPSSPSITQGETIPTGIAHNAISGLLILADARSTNASATPMGRNL